MLLGWHQTLMWTAFGMVVLHMGALTLDPTIHFGLVGVLVPGAAPWRPVPVAAGIVTAWLVLLLATSFNVRRRIGQRRWRLMHYATFGAFAIGLYHALNVGSDLTGNRGLIFAGICLAPVVWLVYARLLMPRARPPQPPARPTPPVVSVVAEPPLERRASGGSVVTRELQREEFRAMGTACAVAVSAEPPTRSRPSARSRRRGAR